MTTIVRTAGNEAMMGLLAGAAQVRRLLVGKWLGADERFVGLALPCRIDTALAT